MNVVNLHTPSLSAISLPIRYGLLATVTLCALALGCSQKKSPSELDLFDVTDDNTLTALSGERVVLDGTTAAGDASPTAEFHWTQLDGPAVPIDGLTAAVVEFIAPVVSEPTLIVINLSVRSGDIDTTVRYTITVLPEGADCDAAFCETPGEDCTSCAADCSSCSPLDDFLTVLLDDFEAAEIRPNGYNSSEESDNLLWNQDASSNPDGGGEGSEETSTEEAYNGQRSLKITIHSQEFYPQFLPYTADNGILNMHDFIQPTSAWQTDTFNRMRFWIKIPPGFQAKEGGRHNFNIGTFLRKSNGSSHNQEDGGGHWYHWYNFDYTGEWHQVIMDTHPHHVRGASGNTEHGDQEYVTNEPDWNYFDGLTRFYLNLNQRPPSYPAVLYFDKFELYYDPNPENVQQVYSLHGVYIPASNMLKVGWSRDKNENDVDHEVRYAFSDIHKSGWATATPAPGGVITPPGWAGYNGMLYQTDQIDVMGYDKIYIAIKPTNSQTFRQIVIPTL